jgi:hypothetical protein
MGCEARSEGAPVVVLGALSALRVVVGVGLAVVPDTVLRLLPGAQPSGTAVLLLRTLGLRDVTVGLAALAAIRGGDTRELARWSGVGMLSDGGDGLAGALAARRIGAQGAAVVAASPLPFLAAGGWVLRRLRADRHTPVARDEDAAGRPVQAEK